MILPYMILSKFMEYWSLSSLQLRRKRAIPRPLQRVGQVCI